MRSPTLGTGAQYRFVPDKILLGLLVLLEVVSITLACEFYIRINLLLDMVNPAICLRMKCIFVLSKAMQGPTAIRRSLAFELHGKIIYGSIHPKKLKKFRLLTTSKKFCPRKRYATAYSPCWSLGFRPHQNNTYRSLFWKIYEVIPFLLEWIVLLSFLKDP